MTEKELYLASAKLCERAALVLEKYGWTTCQRLSSSGARCAAGAIEFAAFGHNYAASLIGLDPGDHLYNITYWNDIEAESAAEVIALLRKTAERERKRAEAMP